MNLEKKKLLLVGILLVFSFLLVNFGIFAFAEGINDFSFYGEEIESVYTLNDVINVPKAKYNEEEVDSKVIFPSGKAYDGKNSIHLTEGGFYQVVYSIKTSGKIKQTTKSFYVETPLYSVSSERSIAKYATDDNDEISQYNSKRTGIYVSLAEGDVFRFNEIINFNETSTSKFAFRVAYLPTQQGIKSDAYRMYLKFTDVYDENNSITIMSKNTSPSFSYTQAKANNQPYAGFEAAHGEHNSSWHVGDIYGAPIWGTGSYGLYGNYDVGFYYKAESRQLWGKANTSSTLDGQIINDFDDATFQNQPWTGFTTGEVKVELWFELYNADTAKILILDIGGKDLSREKCEDVECPTINVDELEIDECVGYAGYSFPVASAKSFDTLSGKLDTRVSVLYEYSRKDGIYNDFGTDYAFMVNIKNGRFETKEVGKYSIVYRAEDYCGNKTEIVKNINVLEGSLAKSIENVVLDDYKLVSEKNNIVDLPKVLSVSGGTGNITVEYVVKNNNEIVKTLGDIKNGVYIVPTNIGNYYVDIICKDELGVSKTQSYVIQVTDSTSAGITSKVNLPKYFFEDVKYTLPLIEADKVSGNSAEIAKIEIIDGYGARVYDNQSVEFKSDVNGNVVLNYYTGRSNKYSYTVPIVDIKNNDGGLVVEKYFIKDNSQDSVVATTNGIELQSINGGKFEFANPLVASSFKITSKFISNNFNSLSIKLSDMYDKNIVVELTIQRVKGKPSKIYINGKLSDYVLGDDIFASESKFDVSYNDSKKTITINNEAIVSLTSTIFGNEFNGFTSGKFYFSVGIIDVYGQSSFMISSINSLNISSKTVKDTAYPIINILGEYGELRLNKGDKLEIFKAVAGYSIEPNQSLTTTFSKDGIVLSDMSGTKLDNVSSDSSYFIEINEYGKYELVYSVNSENGKNTIKKYTFIVLDNDCPNVSLSGKVPYSAKIGEIVLPKVTSTDSSTKNVITFISIYDPYGSVVSVKNNKFVASFEGQYIVRYTAIDEAGNTTYREFAIKVTR